MTTMMTMLDLVLVLVLVLVAAVAVVTVTAGGWGMGLGTGTPLSRAALLSLLRSVGQPPLDDEADMDATLAEIDTTGTGRVTFGDFCTEVVARQTNCEQRRHGGGTATDADVGMRGWGGGDGS